MEIRSPRELAPSAMADVEYELDAEDRIRRVSQAWEEFARENGARLPADEVLGTRIWRWIAGQEVRHLFRAVFERVRTEGGSVGFSFRCDSPARRRFMEMHISTLEEGAIRCRTRLLKVEDREPMAFRTAQSVSPLLAMCSWCKKVRTPDRRWLELEEGVLELHLFESPPSGITHTICDACELRFEQVAGLAGP